MVNIKRSLLFGNALYWRTLTQKLNLRPSNPWSHVHKTEQHHARKNHNCCNKAIEQVHVQSCHDTRPHRVSSIGTPGRGATSEPVAIMMFLALIVLLLPSARLTCTCCALFSVPQPLIYSTYEGIKAVHFGPSMPTH